MKQLRARTTLATDRAQFVTLLLLSLSLTFILFGPAISLPFYSDDLAQIPWTKETALLKIWSTVNPFNHYRPVQFTLWRVWYLVSGDLQPTVLRGMNLLFHAAGGVLAGGLAGRLWNDRLWAMTLSTAAYVVFPFAFDAVLWVSSFCYPLATTLALAAVLLYQGDQRRPSLLRNGTALLLTALAGLTLESAVVVGPTILLLEALSPQKRRFRRALPYLIVSAIPLLLISYFTVVPSGSIFGRHWLDNAAMVLQMAAFPLAPFSTPLLAANVDAIVVALGVGAITAALLAFAMTRSGNLRILLLGAGWILLWSAVPLATQNYNWMRDPPRAFYPAATGVIILWIGLAVTLKTRLSSPATRSVATVALAALLLLPAAWFTGERTQLYALAGDLLWDVLEVETEASPVVFVNLPERITPTTRFFPLGFEGVIPLPPPTDDVNLLRTVNGRSAMAAEARAAGFLLPTLSYTVSPAGEGVDVAAVRSAGLVLVAQYRPPAASLAASGHVVKDPSDHPPQYLFGEKIELLDVTCTRPSEEQLSLLLRWQTSAPVDEMATVFVHIWQDGKLIGQSDGAPLAGLFPFSVWEPQETVQERRMITGIKAGRSRAGIGVYDATTGTRWQARTGDGAPLPEDGAFVNCP